MKQQNYYKQLIDTEELVSEVRKLEPAYKQACNYYSQMKKRFIGQLEAQARIKDSELGIRTKEQIEQSIHLKTLNRQESFTHVQGVFTDLEKEIANFLQNGRSKSNFIKKYKNQIQALKEGEKANLQNEVFAALPKKTNARVQAIIGREIGGRTTADLTVRFANFFTESILEGIGEINKKTAYRTDALAGYAHELAATEALSNAFIRAIHAGSKNVSADVFMTSKTNGSLSEAIAQLKNLEEQISKFDSQNAIGEEEINFSNLFNGLEYFGSQVKLYSVALSGLSRAQGYGVGHRQNLLNTLKSENKNKDNEYITEVQNFKFFNSWNRIVQAMGVANLVWSTGYAQYWMDEFIQNMRDANYSLQFNRTIDGKLTQYVKWGQVLSKDLYIKKLRATK